MNIDFETPWFYAIVILHTSIVGNIIPLLWAFFKKIDLNAAGKWFEDVENLGDQQKRLHDSFGRIKGTLVYWKNRAAAYNILNNSRLLWGLISSGLVPVLLQVFDRADTYATVFMVSFTTWSGFIVVLAYSRKAEERYRGFRMVESAYYDLSRHVLDFPQKQPENLRKQVDVYLRQVEHIRDIGRKVVET